VSGIAGIFINKDKGKRRGMFPAFFNISRKITLEFGESRKLEGLAQGFQMLPQGTFTALLFCRYQQFDRKIK